MNSDKLQNEIDSKLKTYSGELIDLCYVIFELIKGAPQDDQSVLFARICKTHNNVEADQSYKVEKYYQKDEVNNLKKNIGKRVNTLFENILQDAINENYGEDKFYNTVWEKIICDKKLTRDKEKAFAMYYILIDRRIPYCQLKPGLKIDKDNLKKLVLENDQLLNKINFISSLGSMEKPHLSSNLLDIILEQKSYELQVVLLSYAIYMEKDRQKRLLKSFVDHNY